MDMINDRPPLDPGDYQDVDIDDEDNPELTEADFAAARPAQEGLGDAFVGAWEKARAEVMLPQEVADRCKAQGGHWRVRSEDDLRGLVRLKPGR